MAATYLDKFEHSFDPKGRLTVPSEWRSDIHEKTLHVMLSKEGALAVWPESFLNEKLNKIKDLGLADPERKKVESLAMHSQTAKIDDQGRILIKDNYRKAVNIDRKVVLVGCLSHFKIWEAGRWEDLMGKAPVAMEDAFS